VGVSSNDSEKERKAAMQLTLA